MTNADRHISDAKHPVLLPTDVYWKLPQAAISGRGTALPSPPAAQGDLKARNILIERLIEKPTYESILILRDSVK